MAASLRLRRCSAALITVVAAGLLTLVAASPAHAATGTITGTLTDGNGDPVAGVQGNTYELVNGRWTIYNFVTTNASGTYTLGFMPTGAYRIGFDPRPQGFQQEFWDNAATVETATDVVVSADTTTTADFELAEAASVAGTITDSEGDPAAGVCVNAYVPGASGETSKPYWGSCTDVDGSYRVQGLDAGSYRLALSGTGYLGEWYDDQPTFEAATPVPVGATTQLTGVDAEVTRASHLTGDVTNAGGSPLQGVTATAYALRDGDWDVVGDAVTNGSGHYDIGQLPADTYRLGFGHQAQDYLPEFLGPPGDVDDVADALDVVLAADATVAGLDAVLAPAASISGLVKDEATGAILQGAGVAAYRVVDGDWEQVAAVSTGAFGDYTIKGLRGGTYRLGADGSAYPDDYHPEFFDNADTVESATDVVVPAGTAVSRDLTLTPKARISGTVTKVGGAAAQGVRVQAWRFISDEDGWELAASSATAADGTYTIKAVDADTYKLRFGGVSYAREWWSDAATRRAGGLVVVPRTGTVAGIDAEVTPIVQGISGVVTDETGAPLAGVTATLEAKDANGGWQFAVFPPGVTAGNGSYSYPNLGTETTYRLRFSKPGYRQVWYPQLLAPTAEAEFELADNEVRSDVDAVLALASGHITGRVTDSAGLPVNADVTVQRLVEGSWQQAGSASASEGGNGVYDVQGLVAGDYRVQFSSPSHARTYSTEWWDDVTRPADATTIAVAEGQTVSGIDAELADWVPDIGGRVTNAGGSGIPGVLVEALRQPAPGEDWGSADMVYTDADGDYGLNVPEGTYRLRFVPSTFDYAREFYHDAPDLDRAQDVVLGAVPVTGVDEVLQRHGRIGGRVEAQGGAPLRGIEVVVHRFLEGEWQEVSSDTTDADGHYSVPRLAPDDYRVHIGGGSGHAGEWHANAESLSSADDVTVGPGAAVDVDATLSPGGVVSGTVTGAAAPVADLDVELLRQVGPDLEPYRTTETDPSGGYRFGRLPAGVYKVRAVDRADRTWASAWFGGAATPGAASAIPVVAGATVDADLSLVAASHVTGHVRTGLGAGIGGARVAAYRLVDGDWIRERSVKTAGAGAYDLNGLPAGTYRVEAIDPEGEDDPSWWDDASTLATATDIGVAAASTTPAIDLQLGSDALTVSNVTLPSITGTPAVGSTLAASPGTWTPASPTFAYQWLAGGVPIGGATGPSYALVSGDGGAVISVRVTASAPGFLPGTATSAGVGPVTDVTPSVVNSAAPAMSGTAKVGRVVSATPGSWSPGDVVVAYQWLSDGNPIPGATGASFAVPPAQVGRLLSVRVMASRAGWTSATATSSAAKVAAGTIVNKSRPKISGKARVGQKLTVKEGSWTPSGVSFKYKWLANGKVIDGAKKDSFVLTKKQKGKEITVKVTASEPGYDSLSVTSPATKAVLAGN
jgi:5-hydroxyisourate hydrolase-like protein (transthyretin family)